MKAVGAVAFIIKGQFPISLTNIATVEGTLIYETEEAKKERPLGG